MHAPTRGHRPLFLCILILATFLRLYRIADSSFWLDEFCSVECSTGRGLAHVALPRDQWLNDQPSLTTLQDAPPAWRIWTSLGLDNHPPLYFLLLRLWRDVFGESDLAARLLGIPISLAGICFFHDALKNSLGRSTALWASLLAAVSMPQIHFAQEARGYALLGTLGMAACAALVRIQKTGNSRPRIAALSLSVLAMLLTHYFALAGVAALMTYAILALRGSQRRAVFASIVGAVTIFCIVWAPWIFQQRQSLAINNAWQAQAAGHPWQALKQSAILPVRWCSETFATCSTPAAIVLGLTTYALAIARFQIRQALWSLWMLSPVLLVLLIDLVHTTRLLESIRYTLAGSWGLYVLLSAFGKSRYNRFIPAVVAAACLATLPAYYAQRSHARDSAVLADFLQTHIQPNDAVIFASAGRDDWYAGAMYLGFLHYAPAHLAAPVMLLTKPPTSDTLQFLHTRHTIWLVAGSTVPSPEILPGLTPGDSAVFPDIGKLWELRASDARLLSPEI